MANDLCVEEACCLACCQAVEDLLGGEFALDKCQIECNDTNVDCGTFDGAIDTESCLIGGSFRGTNLTPGTLNLTYSLCCLSSGNVTSR